MHTDFKTMNDSRKAEILTLNHERHRLKGLKINKEPEWKSLDDTFAGYAILSYDRGVFAPTNRMIGVKFTTALSPRFIVTRSEWEQAKNSNTGYLFHVWDMQKIPEVLYEFTLEQISPHIPTDNGDGKWRIVEIPLDI